MVTPRDVADWFLARVDEEGGELTHLKLQKLLYYAQAWSLALLDRPIFSEDFEAWAHGPVLQSIWRDYRTFGWEPLPVPEEYDEFDDDTEELLEAVLGAYGEYSGKLLEKMTHRETPWLKARGDLPPEAACNKKITKQSMKTYYKRQLDN